MQMQSTEGQALTPIELKKSVLSSGELRFLHEKVAAIDESAVKYSASTRRGGKKRTPTATAKKSSSKKARTTATAKKTIKNIAKAVEVSTAKTDDGRPHLQSKEALPVQDSVSSIHRAQVPVVEEDEDYDESDSDA
uniref:Uncharacterized protein n=1 Tax=Hyaloperonospora arabidopsidis (strain Emoy2) TaxID=559515 RepID=M4BEX2_HYAAE